MLVLVRRPNQEIWINENIKIKILEINGKQVKIGIEAPKNIQILRPDAKIKYKKSTENIYEI